MPQSAQAHKTHAHCLLVTASLLTTQPSFKVKLQGVERLNTNIFIL